MKKAVFVLISLVMTASSFTYDTLIVARTSEETARNMLIAFQHGSSEEYASLFPTVEEFHALMKQNDAIYGPYSEEARYEFKVDYERYLLPKVKSAFASVITDGKKKGIDWSQVQFVKVIVTEHPTRSVTLGEFTVVFSFGKTEYRLRVQNAFYINGQWKVTQFLTLV